MCPEVSGSEVVFCCFEVYGNQEYGFFVQMEEKNKMADALCLDVRSGGGRREKNICLLMDGKEESQDIYFDLTSSELVNVGHLFETDQIFSSRRDLEAFVRDVGKKNNICIAVLSSKGGEGKGLGDAVVYLGCERSLGYRKNKAKGSVPEVNNKRSSGTKRCNCPFRLKGKEISAATWKLFVIDGNHNHNFPTYNVGRSIISRLSEDEKIKAKELTRAHVPPSQILISIKNENKDNLTTM